MSANPRFSTSSTAGLSGLVLAGPDFPAQAARATTTATTRIDGMNLPMNSTPGFKDPDLMIVPYRQEFRSAFERLNREWIETWFEVEDADREVFRNPEATILAAGGQIFFVLRKGEVLGTCAVIFH